MTPKQSPVAVQRYALYIDGELTPMPEHEAGCYVEFEDYQRDIAAAERRGAEKAIEAAVQRFQRIKSKLTTRFVCGVLISLSIEQILKGK